MARLFVAAIVLAVLAAACSGGSKPRLPAIGTPEATVTAMASASSTPFPAGTLDGIPLQLLTLGGDIALPAGLVVYYNVSGYGKGGGPGRLHRAYRDAAGQLHVDPLGPDVAKAPITWQALDVEHGLLALEVCAKGMCASGENVAYPDSEARLFTSADGGITWTDSGVIPDDTFVSAIAPGDVVVCTCRPGEPERYWHFPSGETISAPVRGAFPANEPGVGLVWSREDGPTREVFDWSGTSIARAATPPGGSPQSPFFVASAIGREFAFRAYGYWTPIPRSAQGGSRLVLATVNEQNRTTGAYRWDGGDFRTTVFVSPTNVLGNVSPPEQALGVFPAALIDLAARTIHPIPELNPGLGAPFVRAALVGTFARVKTGADCLNVREKPAKASLSLGCYKDGVLLRVRPQPEQAAEGVTWIAVETPEGRAGWASAEFLER